MVPFLILFYSPLASLQNPSAAPVARGELAARGLAFEADPTQLIVKGIAYVLALLLFLNALPANVRALGRQPFYPLLVGFALLSVLWSAFPAKVLVEVGHMVGVGLIALALARYFLDRVVDVPLFVARVVGLMLLLSVSVAVLVPSFGIADDGRWVGVAGNQNTLGMLAMVSIWGGASSLYLARDRRSRRGSWAILTLAIVALAGSRSVTASATSVFVVAGLAFMMGLERSAQVTRWLKLGLALYGVGMAIAVIAVAAPSVLDPEGFFGLFGRTATLTGRTRLWLEGWNLAQERPWLGWSFDANLSVIGALGTVGQFHNGYLDLLVRGGWIGLALVLALVAGVLVRVGRLTRAEFRAGAVYLVLVLAILLHNVTEASFARSSHILWVLLVFLYFFLGTPAPGRAARETVRAEEPAAQQGGSGVRNPRRLGGAGAARVGGGSR